MIKRPVYHSKEEKRKTAIKAMTNPKEERIEFQHQDISDEPKFRSDGIKENIIQWNRKAGEYVRRNADLIEAAANESKLDPDILKAFTYTEMARGAYGQFDPNNVVSNTILPGNIDRDWASLVPEANIEEPLDNLRVTARLISEIEQRLDAPRPEDVYSLYNGMAHDRTYRNKETKSTPYFMRRALSDKAWEFEDWALEIASEDIKARIVGRNGSGPEPDASWRPEPRNRAEPPGGFKRAKPVPYTPRDKPALSKFSRPAATYRKRQIEKVMEIDRDGYFKNQSLQDEYRTLLEQLEGTST